jgi:predicted nucleic acid-binding protein
LKAVLDTYPLMIFFKGEKGAEDVQRILGKVEKGEIEGLVSTLTLSEVFYILARFRGVDFAETVVKYIEVNLRSIAVSEGIAKRGGEFKFRYGGGLPLADAIIAATAFEEKAVLISGEKHFGRVKGIEVKSPGDIT